MRKLFFISFIFNGFLSIAQNPNELCGFNLFTNPNSHEVEDFENKIARELSLKRFDNNNLHNKGIYTIPVVVNVIHNGGPENISDSQINSQIQILNEDFRKLPGTKGYGAGVDTKIQFCLAKLNPAGKCTNGIVRIKSPLTNHQTFQRSQLKDLSFWDPDKYLNIYVVNTINGSILGYSSFPSGPKDADGVVIRDDAFGNIGTVFPNTNRGRTLTHEIAHWFGLYHTFQDGCGKDTCNDGDKVCDTPPVAKPNFGCPVNINSCSNDTPDLRDQIQNYTDYSNDTCKSIFTAGQRNRMQATLTAIRTTIWTYSNLLATGCDTIISLPLVCKVIADFTVAKTDLCEGSTVSFTNRSLNNPTGFLWTFQGGTSLNTTTENPTVIYNKPGIYWVSLKVWNATTKDSITKTNYISVTPINKGDSLGINEGFENIVFPWSGISIENSDNGITWQRTTLAAYKGLASVRINNLINTNYGQNDALLLPAYDFTTYTSIPFLRFKWAYARRDANYSDELIVLASKDCGLNWQQVFYRSGNGLATGVTQTTEYIPDTSTIWKTANINLNAFALQSNVLIKIVNVTDGGNCLYIDNINMGDTTLIWKMPPKPNRDNIVLYPNPTSEFFTISSIESLKGYYLSIYDLQGKLCQKQVLQSENKNEVQINHQLANGLYFLELKSADTVFYFKILKQ